LTVFRSGSENPWARTIVAAIIMCRHFHRWVPEEFGSSVAAILSGVRRILDRAGFSNVVLTPLGLRGALWLVSAQV
jgi:hypothetical protein